MRDCVGDFVGTRPALPLGRVNPTLTTASSSCRWPPAGSVGESVRRPFLNLSHSVSFLFKEESQTEPLLE